MYYTGFDLDTALMHMADDDGRETSWTIRQAVEGLQIFGGIGSGKTSGSGRMFALKYLRQGFGGLVLTVKPDEKEMWQEYCHLAGRSQELVIIEPNGNERFNFLKYETTTKNNELSITENIVQVLKTVIQSSAEKSGGNRDDPFWESALDMLLFNSIDLCKLAYGSVTVDDLYKIVVTAPKKDGSETDEEERGNFNHAWAMALRLTTEKRTSYIESLDESVREQFDGDGELMNSEIERNVPEVRILTAVDNFFSQTYRTLNEKTRSIIEFSFSSFLFRLTKEPIYSLFCNGDSTVIPEDSLKGKIILINLPVKIYHKVGRDCQILFKYMWQRAMEKRNVSENDRPVFLWADEAQHFIHEYDADCQATARSSLIATVYLTQNLPNYHANMGGINSEYRVKSFLGTLATQIFHANTDIETNKYASALIGDEYYVEENQSESFGVQFSTSRGQKLTLKKAIRPEEFVKVKTGGKLNDHDVEAYVYVQGKQFASGKNYQKATFTQNYQ